MHVCVGNVQVPVSILVLGKAKFALTLPVVFFMSLWKHPHQKIFENKPHQEVPYSNPLGSHLLNQPDGYIPLGWFRGCEINKSSEFKGSRMVAFFPEPMVRYLEFKLCYHKNLKLFSVRLKELFVPMVLRKYYISDGLHLLNVFS